jgi:hypothetical protein
VTTSAIGCTIRLYMYVCRIPVLAFAPLLTTALLLPLCAGLLRWRRVQVSISVRGMSLALMTVALLVSPAVVYELIDFLPARDRELTRAYIHPAAVTLWSPSVAVPVMLLASDRLFPCVDMSPRVCVSYRFAFSSAVFLFVLLNVVNWCTPGWCESYGFPLPYSWWSDAIMIIDGEYVTAGMSIAALVSNVAVLAFIVRLMFKRYQRHRCAT